MSHLQVQMICTSTVTKAGGSKVTRIARRYEGTDSFGTLLVMKRGLH